jgi:hypothetical protein
MPRILGTRAIGVANHTHTKFHAATPVKRLKPAVFRRIRPALS